MVRQILKTKRSFFFSTESVVPCDVNDPGKNYFNDKLQDIEFLYFSFKNFKTFSRQLKEKAFSNCHLNITNLSKSIDKFKGFLASLNGRFSVVVFTETQCNETGKKNSLLEIPNYSALHKTTKNQKRRWYMHTFLHKSKI